MASKIMKKQPKHGEKTIKVSLRFFTNNTDGEGNTLPKQAWTRGTIRFERNEFHEIIPGPWRHFNSLMEIPGVIERLLIEQDIQLHLAPKMDKYVAK